MRAGKLAGVSRAVMVLALSSETEPRAPGCSAWAGVSHMSSSASAMSATAACPGGAIVTKKRVSKRLGTPGGVSQWL